MNPTFQQEDDDFELITGLSEEINGSVGNGQRDWSTLLRTSAQKCYAVGHGLVQRRPLYERLPGPNHTRLLYIHSASDIKAPLSAELGVVKLDSELQYEALSYRWGNPNITRPMKCNGHAVKITKNLDSALRHIRSPTHVVILWVDALCINQQDMVEKSKQVQNMGNIYRYAERVLVWLSANTYGRIAFEHARRIVDDANFREEYIKNWDDRVETVHLRELTQHEWFHRTWTSQEIGLAAKADVLLGRERLDWDILFQAFKIIEDRVGLEELKSGSFNTDRVTFMYRSFTEKSFGALLLHTSSRMCSDPRDRVFALLSHPNSRNQITGNPIIQVDYTKSIEMVYAEATLAAIQADNTLDDITCLRNPTDWNYWPSWAIRSDDDQFRNRMFGQKLHGFNACNSMALGPVSMSLTFKERPLLSIMGVEVDYLKFSLDLTFESKPWTPGVDIFQQNHPFLQRCFQIIWTDILELPGGVYSDKLQALEDCLTVRCFSSDWPSKMFSDELKTYSEYWEGPSDTARLPPIPDEYLSQTDIWGQFKKAIHQTAIFGTKSGYIGLGPQLWMPDDIVGILCGGKTPFILRPIHYDEPRHRGKAVIPRRYRLMGPCYIPGLMHGEIGTALKDGSAQLIEMEIY